MKGCKISVVLEVPLQSGELRNGIYFLQSLVNNPLNKVKQFRSSVGLIVGLQKHNRQGLKIVIVSCDFQDASDTFSDFGEMH